MFQNENDFQAFFMRHFGGSHLGDWLYAKITKIAGEFIQPEIDLLDITPVAPGQIISAFEFKVLNSNKKSSTNCFPSWSNFGVGGSGFPCSID